MFLPGYIQTDGFRVISPSETAFLSSKPMALGHLHINIFHRYFKISIYLSLALGVHRSSTVQENNLEGTVFFIRNSRDSSQWLFLRTHTETCQHAVCSPCWGQKDHGCLALGPGSMRAPYLDLSTPLFKMSSFMVTK